MRIARFLRFDDAKRVLSNHSTFAVLSSHYYRNLGYENENSEIGDVNENIAHFQEIKRTCELGAATLLSCWTELEGDELSASDWNIFSDRANGIAVISSIDNVRSFLRNLVQDILYLFENGSDDTKNEQAVWDFRDGKVEYYDGIQQPPSFDTMDAWLWKLKRFEEQREYRFAFLSGSPSAKLQTLIFHVEEPKSYIEKIYFGPRLCDTQKHELVTGAIKANVFHLIENVDEVFRR